MSLQIQERTVESIVILELDGRVIAGFESSSLQQKVTDLIGQNQKNIILDLQHVSSIDSTGLGIMVLCHSTLDKVAGKIKLLYLSKRHIELLQLTKLITVFEIFDDEQSAIDSFFPDREVRKFDILEFVQSQQQNENTKT